MPHLSDSQVSTYEQCALQWRIQKIDAVASDEPSEALILGSAFHNALEADGRQRMKRRNRAACMTEKDLVRAFHSYLDTELREKDPHGKLSALLSTLRARGEAMIHAYFDKGASGKAIADKYWPIAVEESFDFPIPATPLDDSGEPWTFQGRIDARTILPNGEFCIMDWKTASKPWPLGAEHEKGQATAYILADLMQGRPVSQQVTFVTFPTRWNEAEQRFTCTTDVRVTKRTLEDVSAYAIKLRRIALEIMEIKRGERMAAAHPHWRCQFCPNLRNCYDGLNWMVYRGRKTPVDVYPDGTPIVREPQLDWRGNVITEDDDLTA